MALLLLALAAATAGCRRDNPLAGLAFPLTPVLSIRSTWAVVSSPLLRVREEPSGRSPVVQHIRLGAVVEVLAKSDAEDQVEDQTGYWYRINYDGLKGWVFGTYVTIYESRAHAEEEAARLR